MTSPAAGEMNLNPDTWSVNTVFVNQDGVLSMADKPRLSRNRFYVDGTECYVLITPREQGGVVTVWGDLGTLPFTAQDPEGRNILLTLMRMMPAELPVRAVIDPEQRVLIMMETMLDQSVQATDVLVEAAIFVHHGKPFMNLFRRYMPKA